MLIYCHSSELSALLDLCILDSWHSLFISCLSSYHQRLQHLIHHVVSGISFLFIFISLILITNLIHFILDISHHHILRQQRHHRSRVCLFHSQLKPQLFHKILFSASFFSRLSSWIRTRTTHAAAAKHAGSRQQDRKVSGTWKTHVIIEIWDSRIMKPASHRTGARNRERRTTVITEDSRETTFLFQRLSVVLQRGNAVSFLGTFPQD